VRVVEHSGEVRPLWQKKDGAWKLIRVLSFDLRDQATAARRDDE
jgi:hypothetical protein